MTGIYITGRQMTYDNFEIAELIDRYIHSARDRQIIKDRLIDGLTFSELADKHFLSERQIKRIVKKADSFLIRYLHN